jgi:uncharacterized membrane protein SirB2
MPIDTLLMLSGITLAFIAFAGALLWSDFQTRSLGK